MFRAVSLILLCTCLCSYSSAVSLKTRLAAEGGIYHSSSRLISQEFLLSRLDISAKYTIANPRLKLNVSSRLRPEIYLASGQSLSTTFDERQDFNGSQAKQCLRKLTSVTSQSSSQKARPDSRFMRSERILLGECLMVLSQQSN